MARELLLEQKNKQGLRLDPRTKLLLIFIISIFVMGGTGGEAMGLIRLVLCTVPAILLLTSKQCAKAVGYMLCFLLFMSNFIALPPPYGDIEFPRSVYNRILLPNPSQCCDCCLCSENNNGQ